METRSEGELSSAYEGCLDKLSGGLELHNTYHQFGDTELRFAEPGAKGYFTERIERIAAGEDVWMAQDMANDTGRVFDFFSGKEKVGSLAIQLGTNQILAVSHHGETFGDVMYEGGDLVEAVNSIEGQLTSAN